MAYPGLCDMICLLLEEAEDQMPRSPGCARFN